MMSEFELISKLLAAKQGDRELYISHNGNRQEDGWTIALGNRSKWLGLGEAMAYGDANADFIGEGMTLALAIEDMAKKMEVPL